jgi:uncharacterized membrane protein
MGFEDLNKYAERQRTPNDYHHGLGYRSESRYHRNYSERLPGREHYALYMINKIWNNRKLRLLFIISVLAFVTIIIIVLIALIPLIFRLFDVLMQGGVKGIVESATGIVDKIWNGSGK